MALGVGRGKPVWRGWWEMDPRRSFMPRSLDSIVVGNGEVFNGLRENYMSERLVKTIREQ